MPEGNKPLQSINYPNLVVLERVLRGTPKLREKKEHSYENSDGHALCYEFRGIGVPPEEIGRPGDIFWDVTSPYILYFRGAQTWQAWNPGASSGSQLLAEHPCLRDRYLWISGSGLTWLAQQSLLKASVDIKQFHTLGDELQMQLAAILCSAPSFKLSTLDIPENRTKHNLEVARRQRDGVPVGPATYSSPFKRKRIQQEPEAEYTGPPGQSIPLRQLTTD
jgi:hypothetical protein